MKEKTFTYVSVAIIVILLAIAAVSIISNSKNKRSLKEEKAQLESVVSQKAQVSQNLEQAKSDLASLNTKESEAEKSLKDAESKLAEKEKSISRLSRENGSLMKDKKELEELQKSKAALDKAYDDLKLEHAASLSRIKQLEDNAITLEAEQKELSERLNKSQTYRMDNVEVYGSRGNKKDNPTICARRTKKLNLNFDVPQSLTEAISFTITTPSGKTITPEDKSLTWKVEELNQNLTASLSYVSGIFENSRKVTLTYKTKEKLSGGEYKIQIFSNNINIGDCRLKLR
jgi:myosin heavy subunit